VFEQEYSRLSSIDENYYARVEQEYSRLPSIDEDFYARVQQEHSRLPSIDGSVVEGMYLMQASYILDPMIRGLMLT